MIPMRVELRNVDIRNDTADDHQHVVHAALAQQLHDPRTDVHMRAGQDRQPDHVGVFLEGGGDDLLGRLPKARVDHLHPGVAECTGNDLGAAIVPVEARLGNDDADGCHQITASSTYSPQTSRSASHISPTVA